MLTNLKSTLSVKVPLFVQDEPEESVRHYTRMNKDGEEEPAEFILNTLNGTMMTKDFGDGVYQKLKVGIQDNRNINVTPLQVYKTFNKHREDLTSGKKHIVAHVSLNPRGDQSGAHAFYPQLEGMEVVESSEEDINFIKGMTIQTSQVV